MQGSPYPTPPSWVEADSIRETTLYLFDRRRDRTVLRRVVDDGEVRPSPLREGPYSRSGRREPPTHC